MGRGRPALGKHCSVLGPRSPDFKPRVFRRSPPGLPGASRQPRSSWSDCPAALCPLCGRAPGLGPHLRPRPWVPDPVLTLLPHTSPSVRLPRPLHSHQSLRVGLLLYLVGARARQATALSPSETPLPELPPHAAQPAVETFRELSLLGRKPACGDATLLCLLHLQ